MNQPIGGQNFCMLHRIRPVRKRRYPPTGFDNHQAGGWNYIGLNTMNGSKVLPARNAPIGETDVIGPTGTILELAATNSPFPSKCIPIRPPKTGIPR